MDFEGEFLYNRKWNGKCYNEYGNIIYELVKGNGKVKEYDNGNNLIFEGAYLNGKRNGKGKEFNSNNKLIFEGVYLNGQRNGKGKEYDKDGNIIFEGEYLNGKKWNGRGIGHIYNSYSYFYSKKENLYEGEYLNGQRNGKGKEYDKYGRLIFEGEYLNGQRNGKEKEYDEDGNIFEHEYYFFFDERRLK